MEDPGKIMRIFSWLLKIIALSVFCIVLWSFLYGIGNYYGIIPMRALQKYSTYAPGQDLDTLMHYTNSVILGADIAFCVSAFISSMLASRLLRNISSFMIVTGCCLPYFIMTASLWITTASLWGVRELTVSIICVGLSVLGANIAKKRQVQQVS